MIQTSILEVSSRSDFGNELDKLSIRISRIPSLHSRVFVGREYNLGDPTLTKTWFLRSNIKKDCLEHMHPSLSVLLAK